MLPVTVVPVRVSAFAVKAKSAGRMRAKANFVAEWDFKCVLQVVMMIGF
jgi:hypothetical protein